MNIGALLAFMATGLSGLFLLATWMGTGGHLRAASRPSRLPNTIVFAHAGLASASFVLWVLYVVLETAALAWLAGGVVVAVITLGVGMFWRWVRQPRRPPVGTATTAEQEFPIVAVAVHGLFALATAVLVALAITAM